VVRCLLLGALTPAAIAAIPILIWITFPLPRYSPWHRTRSRVAAWAQPSGLRCCQSKVCARWPT